MSEIMSIRFDLDMPMTAVEVLTPDLETVQQYALCAGDERVVEVPSSDSFIRLRLPTGRTVNLRHSGDLQYLITPSLIRRSASRNSDRLLERGPSELKSYDSPSSPFHLDSSTQLSGSLRRNIAQVEAYNSLRSVEVLDHQALHTIRPYTSDLIKLDKGTEIPGDFAVRWAPAVPAMIADGGDEVAFEPDSRKQPYELNIEGIGRFLISIPGSVKSAFIRSDLIGNNQCLISVRVGTASPDADAVGGYMAQSDYVSAKTMLDWARKEVLGLDLGRTNPYATIIALYLLLRLEPINSMQYWPRASISRYLDFPDIHIIAAVQCTFGRPNRAKVLNYIKKSFDRGLPVYTEGLHWLSQILRMLGEDGEKYLDHLGRQTQGVVWNSPFTALSYDFEEDARTISLDVAYALEL